jgi:hypothetical protein
VVRDWEKAVVESDVRKGHGGGQRTGKDFQSEAD